jgi:dipeptidyl aminopeptidase/acylaminoacyl peptidase
VTHVTKDDPPFITFHGTKDQRVAFRHAETIHTALQKAGVPSLLVPITNGGHGSVSHPDVRSRGQQFTDKILRGLESAIDTTPLQALPEAPKKK